MVKGKIGLVPKLIVGILVGIFVGAFASESMIRIFVTFSSFISAYISFIIPLMVIAFVTAGIGELKSGAGKLLGLTLALAYGFTLISGTFSYIVSRIAFPFFINNESFAAIGEGSSASITPYFTIPLDPMVDVTSALVFAFIMGLGISTLRGQEKNNSVGNMMGDFFSGFQSIIQMVLEKTIIPLLPFYIAATFSLMSYTGEVWRILSVFWKVYLIIFAMHFLVLLFQFGVAGAITKKNPITFLKNQIPAWLTAVGTQSSATTIPVNVDVAEKNGVSKSIREFVVPLCSTIHLSGSMISLTAFSMALLMMNGMDFSFTKILPFILILGISMVAAPGAPGGAVMSALPFLPIIGIVSNGPIASLMIALYLTQDSFGTACNVSGDNAVALIIDKIKVRFGIQDEETELEANENAPEPIFVRNQ
ncbi:dicarboxylate/amino acid:cation symporter [Jeotgalibaca ciconiae]|uniref:Dicarboxylate/amino acid:cation symporter n=1 Tax=Jeotgalibaca ciconiae TaxID=2496265 RepID=A0A3S9H7M3_9LACT|nr:dicarboxylate/amino acid:cation symporter [Jeotgalibaca ciconiae]AZP03337.1 dicarboxylate/amino acid:cation symporter [Jeotgalibaca ciconiae]HJB23659.1 dicarboxylate/amino acid:cation symporter [Candidatus Jeotgalibaca pullicola]